MKQTIVVLPAAQASLQKLDQPVTARLIRALLRLAETAEVMEHERLRGPLSELCKFRVGDYRLIYRWDRAASTVTVPAIAATSTSDSRAFR